MALAQKLLTKSAGEIMVENRIFNKKLNIPVLWKVAEQIPVLGRYLSMKRTTHVLLLEDLKEGRFRRKRGEFLCKAKIANPKAHESINVNDSDPERTKWMRVRCKKCLEIAQKRWAKE